MARSVGTEKHGSLDKGELSSHWAGNYGLSVGRNHSLKVVISIFSYDILFFHGYKKIYPELIPVISVSVYM